MVKVLGPGEAGELLGGAWTSEGITPGPSCLRWCTPSPGIKGAAPGDKYQDLLGLTSDTAGTEVEALPERHEETPTGSSKGSGSCTSQVKRLR